MTVCQGNLSVPPAILIFKDLMLDHFVHLKRHCYFPCGSGISWLQMIATSVPLLMISQA
jgi:hypothetical protein